MVFDNYEVHIKGNELSVLSIDCQQHLYYDKYPFKMLYETVINDWEDLRMWNSQEKINTYLQNLDILT